MAKTFQLEVITPEKLFYEGEVEMTIVRTLQGDEGFLANHSWTVSLLATGKLKIRENGAERFRSASVSGGFIDVKDKVVIYADSAEWPEDIDLERAKRAKERAESRLGKISEEDVDIVRAKIALTKVLNRIHVKEGMF